MAETPTEQPTERKIARARRLGAGPRSPELTSAALLLAVLGLLTWGGAAGLGRLRALFGDTFAAVGAGALAPLPALSAAATTLGGALAPLLGALFFAALLAALAQAPLGVATSGRPLPRPGPLERMRGWLSVDAVSQLGWGALAFVLVVLTTALTLASAAAGLAALPAGDAPRALAWLGSLGRELVLRLALLLLFVGALAAVPRYLAFRRSMRMGRSELREEQREQYGDPQLRERRRRLQREATYQAAASDLETSALVLTGEGGTLVGLSRPGGDAAPRIAAVGRGEVGLRLAARARALDVPVWRSPALVRRLSRLELGEEIPPDSLAAVARLWAAHVGDAPGKR